MKYQECFQDADKIINHLDETVSKLDDDWLKAKYAGFVAVAGVAVYEVAIKAIFINFGTTKDEAFGHFLEQNFKRMNGNIHISTLKGDHLSAFGSLYKERFKKILDERESEYLREHNQSIEYSYGSLIMSRHDFAHKGNVQNITFKEAINSYWAGKEVIQCLDEAMTE